MKTCKLVRDKIPEIITQSGGSPSIYIANKKEYWEKLKEKLREEIKEFEESESMEEMGDVLEIIDAMIAYKKFNKEEVLRIKDKKSEERGRFEKRIILKLT